MTQEGLKRLESIQALRAIAALFVLCFHASGMLARAGWPMPVRFGAFGVDIFFVISGFVMVLTTHVPTTRRRFITDRIVRVVPIYWLITSIKVASMILLPWPGTMQFDLAHVVASYAFLPWPDQLGMPNPVVLVGWTLNYEMLFYTVFALLSLNPNRLSIVFGAATVVGLYFKLPLILKFWTDPIILEFVMGSAIGLAYLGKRWFVPAAIACIALFLPDSRAFYWGVPSAAAVAALVVVDHRIPRTLLSKLGDSSYALYLTHVPVLSAFYLLVRRLFPQLPGWLIIGVAIPLAVCAGHFIYLTIELPMARWISALRHRRRAGRLEQLPK